MDKTSTLDPRLALFYRQYLQQLDPLSYPPEDVLLEPAIQEQISFMMFDDSNGSYLPPLHYQRRILKVLTSRIESAIRDPNEDEISDRLMEHMIIKTTRRPMSAFKAAQQPSIVSYFLPSDLTARDPACVHIEERRNLLAARGTTGLRVWDACSHLAYYLSSPSSSGATKTTNLIADKNVLELGAGTGLLSILCAGPLRARRVISTDGDGDVVETIRANAALNNSGAPPHHNSAVATTNLVAKVLDWTDEASLPDVLRHNDDNGNGNGDGRIPLDVILGADITYATESLVPLVHILGALEDLYPRVCIIISTVIRNEATYASFVATCAEARFAVATVPFACPPLEEQTGFFHKTTPPIRIVRLTREGENAV